MPTGGFIGVAPTARSSGNAGAASIFLTPLVAAQNGTVSAVLIDFPGAVSSISFKALIYDGSHSALLASGSTVTSVAAGYTRFALASNLSVTAGTTYYVGYVCANSCAVTIQTTGGAGAWFVSGGQNVGTPANPLVGGASNAGTIMCAMELDGTGSAGFGYGADQSSGVTLSASNTVATFSSSSNLGARSIVTHLPADGKLYAEVDVGGTVSNTVAVGINSINCGIGQGVPTAIAYESMLTSAGSRFNLLSNANIALTFASGDTIGLAYSSGVMWWNKNNGSWFGASSTAGSPTAGTGGTNAGGGNWPVAITVTDVSTGTTATFTLRETTGAFHYVPPSGFSPWSSATFPLPVGSVIQAAILA